MRTKKKKTPPAPVRRLAPATVAPLLALLRTEFATGAPTLSRAEEAVTALFRQLGPELVEQLLLGAVVEDPAEKGGRRLLPAATTSTATAV